MNFMGFFLGSSSHASGRDDLEPKLKVIKQAAERSQPSVGHEALRLHLAYGSALGGAKLG